MTKLYILGTGAGHAEHRYNTCFTINNNGKHFLVDTGGGNGIFTQLKKANINPNTINNIFVSHMHLDHMLGIFWCIRRIARLMIDDKYEGNLTIYCHKELKDIIDKINDLIMPAKFYKYVGKRIFIKAVEDGEEITINDNKYKFIDLDVKKDKQFGFIGSVDGLKFVFLGDEPYTGAHKELVKNSDWVMHEAFCLYEEREKFNPYEKGHVTVKEACELVNDLNIKNLILYHTVDNNLDNRKELYTKEANQHFNGNVYVPDDLDVIEIK